MTNSKIKELEKEIKLAEQEKREQVEKLKKFIINEGFLGVGDELHIFRLVDEIFGKDDTQQKMGITRKVIIASECKSLSCGSGTLSAGDYNRKVRRAKNGIN